MKLFLFLSHHMRGGIQCCKFPCNFSYGDLGLEENVQLKSTSWHRAAQSIQGDGLLRDLTREQLNGGTLMHSTNQSQSKCLFSQPVVLFSSQHGIGLVSSFFLICSPGFIFKQLIGCCLLYIGILEGFLPNNQAILMTFVTATRFLPMRLREDQRKPYLT